MAVTWWSRPEPGTGLDATLRGVVVGFRILGWAWMMLLITLTLISDDAADTKVVIGAAILGTIWAAVTVFVGLRTNELGSLWFVLADGIVVFLIGAASTVSGADDLFHGGYLLSWIMVAAYAGGLIAAVGASVVLMIEQIVVHIVDDRGVIPTAGSVMFFIFAIVVGGAFDAVRLYDERRRIAEADLLRERAEAARWEERFAIADQLHDSVLQTLHAIRLTAESPAEVRHLARSQERELRRTIAEMRSRFDDSFEAALLGARDDVEDLYRVEIDVVIRSDAELTDELWCVVDAAREAMVNAAKHSSDDRIELFSEVVDDTLTVYIRDRGTGFDTGRLVPTRGIGRHLAKVEDAGGETTVSSRPGEGTEITLTVAMP
jgi:signal transduction histidine kinase